MLCPATILGAIKTIRLKRSPALALYSRFRAAIHSESLVGKQSANGRASGSNPARRKISASVRGVK